MTRPITDPQQPFHWALAITALALFAGPAIAGPARCRAPEYRQLDFWLGNWKALDDGGKGPDIARDEITATLGGCVIMESYRQNDGHDGVGVTIYDASRKLWHQTWVTNSGQLLILEGRFAGDVLKMSGDNLGKDGKRIGYQVSWKPQAGGVREIALTSKDGGRSWQPAFDILFVKASTDRKG